jgi:hypothetical protein
MEVFDDVPEEFMREIVTREIDKDAIGSWRSSASDSLPFARLVEKFRTRGISADVCPEAGTVKAAVLASARAAWIRVAGGRSQGQGQRGSPGVPRSPRCAAALGMSRTAVAEAVGSSAANAPRRCRKACEAAFRQPQERQAWADDVSKAIAERVAGRRARAPTR